MIHSLILTYNIILDGARSEAVSKSLRAAYESLASTLVKKHEKIMFYGSTVLNIATIIILLIT